MTHINHDAYAERILAALKDQTVPMKLNDLARKSLDLVSGREIDRTLQKLRREGRIEFVKGAGCGWRLPAQKQAEAT
jgi:DNA-binding IscR family transcriptional regulator